MGPGLYTAALTMLLVAAGFAAAPLFASYRRQSAGFARLPLLAVIVVFGLAIGLYAAIGRPDLRSAAPRSEGNADARQAAATPSNNNGKAASVHTLLGGLEARLEANPDDGEGWLLLAKSYDHLGRPAQAYDAYQKAAALGVVDGTLASRLETRAAGDVDVAREVSVSGRVSVDPDAALRLDGDDAIFVVAGRVDRPMPLAVIRRRAADLPFDFVLNDANAMVAGQGISSAAEIVVSAKVSPTGDALVTDPELSISTPPFDPRSNKTLELVLGSAAAEHSAEDER